MNNSTYKIDWNVIDKYVPELLKGLSITLEISAVGMALALIFGLMMAVGRLNPNKFISTIADGAVQLCRAIPLFVLLFWIYYGLSLKFNLLLTEFQAGALSLGITGGAYMAEVFRSGLLAISPGQSEAGLAIGLSKGQVFRGIVLPQALRIVIPPTVNVYVGLLKGATIVSIIGVSDMIYVARYVSLDTFTPFELYTVAGLIFVSLTLTISGFAWLLEHHLGRSKAHV